MSLDYKQRSALNVILKVRKNAYKLRITRRQRSALNACAEPLTNHLSLDYKQRSALNPCQDPATPRSSKCLTRFQLAPLPPFRSRIAAAVAPTYMTFTVPRSPRKNCAPTPCEFAKNAQNRPQPKVTEFGRGAPAEVSRHYFMLHSS